ncbi:MAG: helix-turn-helix domain-containing protein [Candidatus Eisenbacteria bacterium]
MGRAELESHPDCSRTRGPVRVEPGAQGRVVLPSEPALGTNAAIGVGSSLRGRRSLLRWAYHGRRAVMAHQSGQEMLRPADIAPLLGVSRSRVYQLLRQGLLPSTKCGRAFRIPRAAWDQWLANQAQLALDAVRGGAGRGSET